MATNKPRFVVYLDKEKAKRVRDIADRKKWDLTVFIEECIDLGLSEYEG